MLKEYLLNNFEELEVLVSAINSWNGALEHLVVWENDEEFFKTYFPNNAMEAVRACYYGDYKYNDPYVKFDGYMNLVSYNEVDYKWLLQNSVDEIIQELYRVKDECTFLDEKVVELADQQLAKAFGNYIEHYTG